MPRRKRPPSSPQAKSDAEEYAAETRRKLSETLDRRTRQAEQKIAQAEAAAIKDVRNAATEMAIAAAQTLMAEATKGAKGADLIASSIQRCEEPPELSGS